MFSALFAQTTTPRVAANAEAATVLLDFQHFAILLLLVGLLIGGLRGRWKPREERVGVPSQQFNVFDLFVVLSILGFYYAIVFLTVRSQINPSEAVETGGSASTSTAGQFLASLIMNGFYVVLILVMVKFGGLDRDPKKIFGLNRLKISEIIVWSVVGGVIATPAVLSMMPLMQDWLTPLFGPLGEQEVVSNVRDAAGFNLDTIFLVVSAVVIAPVAEELIFRGYFYGILKRFTDPMFACLTAGAFFAVVHLNLPALLPLWFFAIFLTLLYEATRSLWVTIAVHAFFNATNIVLMFVGQNEGKTTASSSFFFGI